MNRDARPDPPSETTLLDLLRRRASELPDRAIYHWLGDDFFDAGELNGPSLSYGQVDCLARALGVALRARIDAGERVLLLFAPGLEFIPAYFGCLYAGVIPVPAYPPHPGPQLDPLRTLRGIVADCSPAAVITGGAVAESIHQMCATEPALAAAHWFTTDSVDRNRAGDWRRPPVDAGSVALLQYTSGSTGDPRGVLLTHGNIMCNSYMIQLAFDHMTDRRSGHGVCWLPFNHDMGLIGNVIQAIFVDGPCYLLSPLEFLRRPLRWLEAISRLGAHSSGGPNFAYDLCVRRAGDTAAGQLDLSSWEVAVIGAERVSPETIDRFSRTFEPCGFRREAFYPCYGLAEATLLVTGGDFRAAPVVLSESDAEDSPGHRALVGCGSPWLGQKVIIVDPESLTECAPGVTGEIWVAGPCVAQGYWNRPDDTARTFSARLKNSDRGPFLRTGDMGFIHEGELFISGRLKDVIIIRGRNYFPDDIEATVWATHPALRPNGGAAFGIEREGEERLVVVVEIDRRGRRLDLQQLAGELRLRIAQEHELELYDIVFLRKGTLPRTTSGKVRRFACRALYDANRLVRWEGKASK